jgi:uncharacterized repeat protein (TIGR04052 family)
MRTSVLLAAAGIALLCAPATAQQSQSFTIRFAAEIGGKPFACDQSYAGVGTTSSTIRPADFRLYVSDIELVRADGSSVPLSLAQDGKWQFKSVALLDFENAAAGCSNGTPEVRDVVVGSAPTGNYTGLKFKVGVPFELNHGDPTLADSPLNLTAMFWTWQSGYKFIKIDMATAGQPIDRTAKPDHGGPSAGAMKHGTKKAAATAAGFSIHLGSTMCQSASRTTAPSSCANGNRMEIAFKDFDPSRNVIVLDPAPVLATTNVDVNTPETSPGCMSFLNDPECLAVMPKLGFAYGGRPAEAQAFVRMR